MIGASPSNAACCHVTKGTAPITDVVVSVIITEEKQNCDKIVYRLVKYEHDKELKMTVQEQNKTKPEKQKPIEQKETGKQVQCIYIQMENR